MQVINSEKVDIRSKNWDIESAFVTKKNVTDKIEMIYKQIKINEIAPKTEYLFNGLDKKKSIEKSLKQMELVNSIISKEP